MRSFYDEKGGLWVACCECERGGNGTDKDKCSCGWKAKRWNGMGCFVGNVIAKFKPALIEAMVEELVKL